MALAGRAVDNVVMIFIVVRFTAKPEHAETFIDEVSAFTEATRAEPGNLWFDWSRSIDDPNTYVLVEAFRDGGAGSAHVSSRHFADGIATLSRLVDRTPQIINVEAPGTEWSAMGEITVEPR